MNVASLNLCKELYKLSGWTETGLLWCSWEEDKRRKITKAYVTSHEVLEKNKDVHGEWPAQVWDAYDLGYLLRKLPSHAYSTQYGQKAYLWMRKGPNKYCVWCGVINPNYYGEDITIGHSAEDDTPEDAVCKLSIELFKQGVLKRED